MEIATKIANKINERLTAFWAVRRGSNAAVGFKTEILSVFVRDPQKHQQLIQTTKLAYLKRQYGYLVEKYAGKTKERRSAQQPVIWQMWWQGYDNMPPIVKACLNSVKRHTSQNVKIVLLTKDNFSDYVRIPDYILKKVEKGIITLTHLSDIIRMACLAEHGGIWLDSTLYVTRDIPDSTFSKDWFSLSTTDPEYSNISMCKWCSFAIGGGNLVFDFMKDLFYTHWKDNDAFIDYFTIDYGLRLYYDAVPAFKEMIDREAATKWDIQILWKSMNEMYAPEKMSQIIERTMYSKLTYKVQWNATIDGKETFYGHLISE